MTSTEYSSLMNNFRSFIDSHRTKTNITHTSLGTPKGSFSFVGKYYQQFMEQYVNILEYTTKNNLDANLHFVERPNSNGVTLLFIDIDYDHQKSKRLYTEEHITHIVQTVNHIVSTNFDVTEYQLQAFVTEKPKPTKRPNKDIYKDGLHIYYPYLPMTIKFRYFVMDCLTQLLIAGDLLSGIKYLNKPETIFDTSIVKNNGILMIGSKKEGSLPYKLTNIYNTNLNKLSTNEYDNE